MKILSILQVVVSTLLICFVLLQQRGAGVSSLFGGEGGYYFKKRGIEKVLFFGTVFLSMMFLGLALANFLL